MRSPLWFVLAGVVAVAGFVAAGFHVVSGLGAIESRLMQVVMPGSVALNLSEPGTYTIYYERKSVVDGRVHVGTGMSGLRLSMRGPGGDVRLVPNSGGATYTFGGREGRSIYSFTATIPGEYRITGTLPDGRGEPKVVLAVETGLIGGMALMIGGALAMAFGGLAIAGILVIVTLLGRQRAKRA
jgi:hypothetical protein